MRYQADMIRPRKRINPLLVGALVLCLLGACLLNVPGPAAAQTVKVGGPCEYAVYPGRAEIVTVEPVSVAGETRASIKFVFHPDQPLPANWTQWADHPQSLKMVNGTEPSISFMEKYELEVGRFLPCHLKTITKGACTPAIFDFLDVDRADYQP